MIKLKVIKSKVYCTKIVLFLDWFIHPLHGIIEKRKWNAHGTIFISFSSPFFIHPSLPPLEKASKLCPNFHPKTATFPPASPSSRLLRGVSSIGNKGEREKKKFFVCLRSIEKAFPESGKTQFAGGKKKKRGNPNQSSSCRVVAVIRVSPGAWVCLQSWEAFICLSFKKIGNKVFYSVCLSETTNNNFVFAFVELFLFLLHRKES